MEPRAPAVGATGKSTITSCFQCHTICGGGGVPVGGRPSLFNAISPPCEKFMIGQ